MVPGATPWWGFPRLWQSPEHVCVCHVLAEAVNPSGGSHPLTASDEFPNGPVMAAVLPGGLAPAQ